MAELKWQPGHPAAYGRYVLDLSGEELLASLGPDGWRYHQGTRACFDSRITHYYGPLPALPKRRWKATYQTPGLTEINLDIGIEADTEAAALKIACDGIRVARVE